MSRKASTTSSYFVPFEGIEERVFEHKLEELFGSKARYSEAPSGDGWLVRKYSTIPKDAIKQLQRDTNLVQNVLRDAQERQERANQERARPTRAHPDTSAYGYGKPDPAETRLPVRTTDNERNESESRLYGRVASRPQPISDPYRPHPARHSSIVDRGPSTTQPPGYPNTYGFVAPGLANTDASTRPDGYLLRSSSLLPGTLPQDIPQSSSRHNASQDLMRDRDVNEISESVGRSGTRHHHADYGNDGKMNAKTAARDFRHVYVQADFPDIFEWRQYHLEKEEYNRKRAEQETRRLGTNLRRDNLSPDDSLSEESTDEKTAAPRHPRIQESKPFVPMTSNTRRHEVDYNQAISSRTQPESLPKSQIMKSSRPREAQIPDAPPAYEATASRRPPRHNDDRYDPLERPERSERPPRPPTPPSRPDSRIGHSLGSEDGGGKQSKSFAEFSKANPKDLVKPTPSSKSRHNVETRLEAQKSTSVGAALIKPSSKDQVKSSSKSASKGTSRHNKDSISRPSRPAIDHVKSYHDEDRESDRSTSSEEDVSVQSNSRRRRDPEYNERRRHKQS